MNFDLPRTVGSYTHRIGRTARGGRDGIALTLVDFDQQKDTFIEIFSEQESTLFVSFFWYNILLSLISPDGFPVAILLFVYLSLSLSFSVSLPTYISV